MLLFVFIDWHRPGAYNPRDYLIKKNLPVLQTTGSPSAAKPILRTYIGRSKLSDHLVSYALSLIFQKEKSLTTKL